MDWLTRMKASLVYIENNLTGEIDHEELAKIACCSSYNFRRTFSFITDISLSEYIRRRRLTLAALELQSGDAKVIDLAVKYGYDSPVSFSRAFQALHGVTPTDARLDGAALKAYPRISFQISIKGDTEMDYRIETKEGFQVYGVEEIFNEDVGLPSIMGTDTSDAGHRKPSDLWEDSLENGMHQKLEDSAGELPAFVGSELSKVHAVCDYRETGEGTFPYMLCAFNTQSSDTGGFTIVDIPAHTWAIFPSGNVKWDDFGDTIGNMYKRFFTEWIPTSEYEQVGSLDMELYGGDDEHGYVELWFAVQKK
ncbi:MAG: AraC family transcriptional regulator [Oscillospiraceae bacterium]|nr:AraC family transcriptional regulator [Oscillospiraceae bacterium]